MFTHYSDFRPSHCVKLLKAAAKNESMIGLAYFNCLVLPFGLFVKGFNETCTFVVPLLGSEQLGHDLANNSLSRS